MAQKTQDETTKLRQEFTNYRANRRNVSSDQNIPLKPKMHPLRERRPGESQEQYEYRQNRREYTEETLGYVPTEKIYDDEMERSRLKDQEPRGPRSLGERLAPLSMLLGSDLNMPKPPGMPAGFPGQESLPSIAPPQGWMDQGKQQEPHPDPDPDPFDDPSLWRNV
jgi:hypothetical protein